MFEDDESGRQIVARTCAGEGASRLFLGGPYVRIDSVFSVLKRSLAAESIPASHPESNRVPGSNDGLL